REEVEDQEPEGDRECADRTGEESVEQDLARPEAVRGWRGGPVHSHGTSSIDTIQRCPRPRKGSTRFDDSKPRELLAQARCSGRRVQATRAAPFAIGPSNSR